MTNRVEVKTSELLGPALDWAVADCLHMDFHKEDDGNYYIEMEHQHGPWLVIGSEWTPSTNWSQGGPLIEQFGIMLVDPENDGADWEATTRSSTPWTYGSTPLVAVCRAIVLTKLGDTVQVPRELLL